ncbi:MAG: response regulator [Chloroflexi bacterium]|nr:response regulator [Chloroflexota bacterium]
MSRKILIVEGDDSILALLGEILGDLGDCVVVSAGDGEAGIKVARDSRPDIILLDVPLSKLDGYEVCRTVKSDPNLSHTKVLILSGFAQNSDRRKAELAGADGYIIKPFASMTLVAKVLELLDGAKKKR